MLTQQDARSGRYSCRGGWLGQVMTLAGSERNIGWGRRFPIRNPSDRTLPRASSNDFADERSDDATMPVQVRYCTQPLFLPLRLPCPERR